MKGDERSVDRQIDDIVLRVNKEIDGIQETVSLLTKKVQEKNPKADQNGREPRGGEPR